MKFSCLDTDLVSFRAVVGILGLPFCLSLKIHVNSYSLFRCLPGCRLETLTIFLGLRKAMTLTTLMREVLLSLAAREGVDDGARSTYMGTCKRTCKRPEEP